MRGSETRLYSINARVSTFEPQRLSPPGEKTQAEASYSNYAYVRGVTARIKKRHPSSGQAFRFRYPMKTLSLSFSLPDHKAELLIGYPEIRPDQLENFRQVPLARLEEWPPSLARYFWICSSLLELKDPFQEVIRGRLDALVCGRVWVKFCTLPI